ncbi:hypothetical protein Dimus_005658 [Dionaea muscipula]
MAQMGGLNNRLAIARELENVLEPAFVHKIQEMTRINIEDELLKEIDSLYGFGEPRIKYLHTHPKIVFIELGLVNEIWIKCDEVPDNFPAMIRYILKNVIDPDGWLSIEIVSTVASRCMEKFYQPYQIWNIYLLSQNPVRFEGCRSTREDVLAIDPLRYQVHCYRQFLTKLNELKMMYECGVVVPSFFDGRRIVCIADYRIQLNLVALT